MAEVTSCLSDSYEGFKRSLIRAAARNHEELDAAPLEAALTSLFAEWEKEEEKGSVCVRRSKTKAEEEAAETLKAFGLAADGALFNPKTPPSYGLPAAPFVIDGEEKNGLRFYSNATFFEESMLAFRISELAKEGCPVSKEAQDTFANIPAQNPGSRKLSEEEKNLLSGHELSENGCNARQLAAIAKSMQKKLTVICGGPGTGKTTSGTYILSCFLAQNPDATVYLTAPTGKASSRLREAILENYRYTHADSVIEAMKNGHIKNATIHRLLVTETSQGRKPSPETPLECDLLLIDEASMIDSTLAYRLFSVIDPKRTKVVILGDKDQLAAVGPGAVYADISDPHGALAGNLVELTEARRFNYTIQSLARAINRAPKEGETDAAYADAKLKEVEEILTAGFVKNDAASDEENAKAESRKPIVSFNAALVSSDKDLSHPAEKWLRDHLKTYAESVKTNLSPLGKEVLPEEEKEEKLKTCWDVLSHFRALAAQREGRMSVAAINAFSERLVKQLTGVRDEDELYCGKVIIVRKNDPAFDISNGDVGIIYRDTDGNWQCYFGDLGTSKPAQLLPENDTAFAITIHQSQGSGFNEVAVFLPYMEASESKQSVGLATQELLYTGVTRAKDKCVIFGSPATLKTALSTRTKRSGGLALKLEKYMKP
jgi:exodeoxyribonuclease V alpha subunit